MESVVKALKQVGDASVRPAQDQRSRQKKKGTVLTIAARIFRHIQFLKEALHQGPRNRGSGNDARAQIGAIEVVGLGDTENGLKHSGDTM